MVAQKKQILIVEDQPIIAADLASFLRSADFKIAGIAHTGEEAIDLLHNRLPDLVLLDIHLGTGMSGIDVAEVIHSNYQIPYVFLTSFDDEDTLQQAQEFSPYGFLVKPFQERSLLTTIKLAIHQHEKVKKAGKLDIQVIQQKAREPLSEQEVSIVDLLLKGKSYKQITHEKFISINTVKFHAKNIYRKLAISSRSELSSLLLQ